MCQGSSAAISHGPHWSRSLGIKDLVMHEWPTSALISRQLWMQHSRAKGITVLKVHKWQNIYHSLENNEISIVKVKGRVSGHLILSLSDANVLYQKHCRDLSL